ncbi:TonB-dependent receptor [Parahaliea sp. F7430]|uniref:TonB-dependent receptor n=1 Tax=Sediminihaliea albiluteola TaxID=2758564 RepID=A0A7W2TXI8_9GAMM|nr:TonB-dependent receptor [Sediminihaliea albiluteola]MBA6413773.1 TonB-dependent receptor [Sediminihaliea albiluteola]
MKFDQQTRFTIKPLVAAIAGCALLSSVPSAQAQNTTTSLMLEEVVVTARKRAETMADAPVAIAALGRRSLEQYNITRIEDMASLAGGSVIIADSGVTPTVSIRGVSSDSTNAGFDQSVGLIIDGVFYDRSRWTQQGFFDAAQVEILKGPQALFFGKSTVAGAVVLTTADPTEEFEGEVTVGHEFEANEWYTKAYVSGALSDTLGARLAFSYLDSDGWLKNQTPNGFKRDIGGEEEFMGRLTLLWQPSDDLSANFKIQGVTNNTDGAGYRAQLYNCRGPSPTGTTITGIPADLGPGGAPFPIADDCKLNDKVSVYPGAAGFASPPKGEFESVLTSLNVNWDLGDWTLTSVTGWNDYTLDDQTGYVASQGNIAAKQKESNKAFSQEFRIMSDFDGPLNVLAGINYQKSEFLFRNASQIILAIPDPRNGRVDSQDHTATQDSDYKSVFGEVTWAINPEWTLSAGARYSREEKDAEYKLPFVNQWFETIFGFPFWLPEGTHIKDRFKDSNVSPQVTLQWAPKDNWNVFASYREGFLPGGFSLGATPQAGLQLEDFQFDSEEVKGYELGFKGLFLGDSLSLDVIAYDYEFTNLQVNVYVPETASFVVGNAGKALTEGLEASLRWQASEYLQLHASATYNKGEYDNYKTQCYTLQSAAQGCNTSTNIQDMSGKSLPRAPEYTVGAGALFTYPLGEWEASFATDLNWSDDFYLDNSASPFLSQDSYVRVDMTLALESMDRKWRAAVIGRNITDEVITTFGATRGFTNDNLATLQPLMRWGVELSYRF